MYALCSVLQAFQLVVWLPSEFVGFFQLVRFNAVILGVAKHLFDRVLRLATMELKIVAGLVHAFLWRFHVVTLSQPLANGKDK